MSTTEHEPAPVTSPGTGEMTLVEHLAELRDRLVRAVVALVLGSIVGYIVFPWALEVLIAPYCDLPQAFRPNPDVNGCALVATRALEPFSVRIKTSLVIGLFLGGPVIFTQLWRFITPGLTTQERRYAAPFVVGSQVMFGVGIAFAYLILPRALGVLLSFGGPGIAPLLSASDYISFFLTTAIAFGIVFELPLVLILLALVGVLSSSQLAGFRRYAVIIMVIGAAIITPTTDAVTLLFMVGPMLAFYELSIVVARLVERSRRRRAT